MELERARAQLPPEWRRVDLKRILGQHKARAAELIHAWMEAGHVEDVPGMPATYRFTESAPAPLPDQGTSAGGRWQALRGSLAALLTESTHRAALRERFEHFMASEIGTAIGNRVAGGRWSTTHNWVVKALLGVALVVLIFAVVSRNDAASLPADEQNAAQPAATSGPRLEQPVVAWFAPGQSNEVFGAIATGARYTPVARYGDAWVQLEFPDIGLLWVQTSDFPALSLADLPNLMPPVVGYSGYTVQEGDTLHRIAQQSGSMPSLIVSYNRLEGEPSPGRPLVLPQLEGQVNLLPPATLLVKRGSPEQPRVALTIDIEMGDARVGTLLDILRERQVTLTMFVLGSWVQNNPDLVRQMVADGHELGSHSLSHSDFRNLRDEQIAQELAETERIIQEATGASSRPYFRPPYGGYDERVLHAVVGQGYLPLHWSIDSRDSFNEPAPEVLVEQIIGSQQAQDMHGEIVLVHCCSPQHPIVEALPLLLDRFGEMGLEVTTVSDVLGR
jgi:peptidoglycan/xylan/chitin deacetylase (PgdA/CDA1 family)